MDVSGRHFPAGLRLVLGFGPVQSEYETIDTVSAGSDGSIDERTGVPDWARAGRPYVFVLDAVDDTAVETVKVVSNPILVVSPGDTVTIEGRRVEGGVECPAFRSVLGVLYTLTGSAASTLATGEDVLIRATVPDTSFCMQGIPLAVIDVERR